MTVRHIAYSVYISSVAILFSLILIFYLQQICDVLGVRGVLIPSLYLLLSFPFVAIGICLSLIFSRFPERIGKIYSVNLVGSAAGCIGIIAILNNLSAPSAAACIASLSALSALCFAIYAGTGRTFRIASISAMLLFAVVLIVNERNQTVLPTWVKGAYVKDVQPYYSRWNFYSYITVRVPPRKPFGWGFSNRISSVPVTTDELMLVIDEGAGTVLTRFRDLSDLEYLKLDVTNVAYRVREAGNVLVIGSGGGRDLLTAVLFGAKKVTGVEINGSINDIAFNTLREFSGSIRKFSQIQWINDEGRSYLSRSKEKYGIIQASLVDSFAAYANGAFALTENSLYTREGWGIFLNHLTDRGMLTFSRWYGLSSPVEIYRLVALAKSSLDDLGIRNSRQNIMLVRSRGADIGVGTILVSKTPFSGAEVEKLRRICDDLGFDLVLSPMNSSDHHFDAILENKSGLYSLAGIPSNINPPTDDKPFFFYSSHLGDIFSRGGAGQDVAVLQKLFLTIVVFGIIFILIPLIFKPRSRGFREASAGKVIYFAAIGFGFMLVEIPLIQRFGIYLGHPVYGLTVVLFSLLFSCGIGSYMSRLLKSKRDVILLFAALAGVIGIFIMLLPSIIQATTPASGEIKIIISGLLLMTIGFFMGMPFPVGMTFSADEKSPRVLFWGINGFTSVCGSAFAAVIIIHFGFQYALVAGLVSYIIAFLSLVPSLRGPVQPGHVDAG